MVLFSDFFLASAFRLPHFTHVILGQSKHDDCLWTRSHVTHYAPFFFSGAFGREWTCLNDMSDGENAHSRKQFFLPGPQRQTRVFCWELRTCWRYELIVRYIYTNHHIGLWSILGKVATNLEYSLDTKLTITVTIWNNLKLPPCV